MFRDVQITEIAVVEWVFIFVEITGSEQYIMFFRCVCSGLTNGNFVEFFFFNHVFTSMPQWKLQCAIQVTVVVSYPLYLKRLLSAINSLGLLTKQLVVGLPYRLYRERIPNPKSCLDWRQTEGEGVRGEGRCKGQVFNIRGSLQSTTTGV